MIYIFEGMDNCLKDTLIQLLRSKLSPQTQILKYSNPPRGVLNPEQWQKAHFTDMFDLLKTNLEGGFRNLILNRAHLGEYVYSPIYRDYDGGWIFDLEKAFLRDSTFDKGNLKLFVFYDSDNLKLNIREDGNSLSDNKDENLDKERTRFLEAFEKSSIANKQLFNLSDYPSNLGEPNRVDTDAILRLMLEL